VPSGAARRRSTAAVVYAAQPGTGGKIGFARRVQGPRPGERPGLPSVAQEAQGSCLDLRPAKPQHHRLQVKRGFGEVANQEIVTRDVARRVESNRQLEWTEALDAGDQGPLDEADGADHPLLATLREGRLGEAHSQANHLQTSPAVQTCDRGPSLHFSPARYCGRRSHRIFATFSLRPPRRTA
jgi:hypothetical protein